jgi:hypothetical protein
VGLWRGSGPAQLALAILADYLGDDERALRLHQEFKWTAIAKLAATNGDCRRLISKVGLNDIADPLPNTRRRKRLTGAAAGGHCPPTGIIRMKNTVVGLHRYKDPAAYRPQPAREGPDFWPTIDRGLILALVYEVLPALPVGVIWEAAAGAGHLVDPLRAAGCEVIGTDLFPDPERPDFAVHDFLHAPSPNATAGAVMITNPPNSKLTDFIVRGLTLIDAGYLKGMALLTRLGADTTKGRGPAFNRAANVWKTCWRPYWKPRQKGDSSPRWTAQWTLWLHSHPGPPVARNLDLAELTSPKIRL